MTPCGCQAAHLVVTGLLAFTRALGFFVGFAFSGFPVLGFFFVVGLAAAGAASRGFSFLTGFAGFFAASSAFTGPGQLA